MEYIEEGVVNPNRTESELSYSAFSVSYSLREKLSKLYHHPYPESIAFTRNVTEALNWIIKGLFTSSDHVIVSSNEHKTLHNLAVYVLKDACASRNKSEYKTGLELLKQYGAKVTCLEITLFEWLKSSKNPKFKEVQALIK